MCSVWRRKQRCHRLVPIMLRLLLAVIVVLLLIASSMANEKSKFILVSAPRSATVVYFSQSDPGKVNPLIQRGLKAPQGLAVDQARMKLYVADPDHRKIFSYGLYFKRGALYADEDPAVAAQNVEARWVTVDGVGNIFLSDERNNLIQKVSAEQLRKGDPSPVTLYSGKAVAGVSAPGGVAVDNFHIFWSNKALGATVGSIVKGFEHPPDTNIAASVRAIAKNAKKVYGLCLTGSNVYFTNADKFIYGVKKNGGPIAEVSDKLQEPRGCSWDGDGTVYIADKVGNKVYSFPGNMRNIAPARLTQVVDFEDAFGVAVVSNAHRSVLVVFLAVPLTALASLVRFI